MKRVRRAARDDHRKPRLGKSNRGSAISNSARSLAKLSRQGRKVRLCGSQCLVAFRRGTDRERYLVGNFQAVAFECDHFSGMIGQYANAAQTEISEDLCADSALMLDQALAPEVLVELSARVVEDSREADVLLPA